MSDKTEKAPAEPGAKPLNRESAGAGDQTQHDVAAPADGDIDLARLAPQLRGLYRELLAEPIPDRFAKLLDELANKETNGK